MKREKEKNRETQAAKGFSLSKRTTDKKSKQSNGERNFKVRAICSVVMFVLVFVSLGTFNGLPFRILYCFAAFIALLELFSFFSKRKSAKNLILAILEAIFLVLAGFFSFSNSPEAILSTVVCIASYDIFAYLFGRVFGGKFFPDSRPFPHVSKNKTWEGTILGLISSLIIAHILISVGNSVIPIWLPACGILALLGDLFESAMKRAFSVKDSNEIVLKYPFFKVVELLVGGNEGHGGYLDRLDSFAFTTSIIYLVMMLV